MNASTGLTLLLCIFLQLSCARTVYTNLHPAAPTPDGPLQASRTTPQYWRHFFIFGWVPGELPIDAEEYCGSTEAIERIETRQTFAQGLIAAIAGYYINIYSPYSGRVVCKDHAAR